MEYNTQRKTLLLPEYGRNILLLVEHLEKIEDKEERNQFAYKLIDLMGSMNPHLRDINNFKHILWDHLAIMTNFNLDIDWQYPLPTREEIYQKPTKLPYTQSRVKFRYYGKTIEKMLCEASDLEEGREKENLIRVIGNHMKKQYLMWNKEVVDDVTIVNDIDRFTEGKILLDPRTRFTDSRDIKHNTRKKKQRR